MYIIPNFYNKITAMKHIVHKNKISTSINSYYSY